MTPDALASQVRQASEAAQQQGRRELANAVQRVDAAGAGLERLAEGQRTGRKQVRQVAIMTAVGAVAGVMVWVCFPGPIARPPRRLDRAGTDGRRDVAAGSLGSRQQADAEREPAWVGEYSRSSKYIGRESGSAGPMRGGIQKDRPAAAVFDSFLWRRYAALGHISTYRRLQSGVWREYFRLMSEDGILSFLPVEVWPALAGRLWHATHIDKALAIIADGAIRPDAASKYKSGYCRSLGGVSLFDFRQPDEHAAEAFSRGAGHWLGGHHAEDQDEIGVWFEIDPERAPPHISSMEIFKHWQASRSENESGTPRPRDPMPYCEACHRGIISLAAVAGILLIDARRPADHVRVATDQDFATAICNFRATVRAKPRLPRGLADLLREARARNRDEDR